MADNSGSTIDQFAALRADDPDLRHLRTSIRQFLHDDRQRYEWQPAVDAWLSGWDEEFSARLGGAGFLGLTIPNQYGGRGKSHLHRYVVNEELLAAGAPVAAHWFADRQVGPAILGYGSQTQRNRLLPQISSGRLSFAIGMSEHGAGSDLAAVQTRASPTAGGWLLKGTKAWTSGAHRADLIVILARTAPFDPARRHSGFSQFLVSPDSLGLTISPIEMMSGEHHFNEVVLEDVFVADDDVLGDIGNGWNQVTSELSYERSGPERILTTVPLIIEAIRTLAGRPGIDTGSIAEIGSIVAELISLRQLSISVARALEAGKPATNQAALVKDLGTRFEQRSVDLIDDLLASTTATSLIEPELSQMLTQAHLHKPVFTLRGGTNEVLRGVVSRGMGLR